MKNIVGILCIVFVLSILLLVMPSAAANVAVNISATLNPSTVPQGDSIYITGTAIGHPSSVAIWVFGPKGFAIRTTTTVNVDGSFSYEITQDTTKYLYGGQYYVVVQHMGVNGLYDIDLGADPQYVYDYHGTTAVSVFKITGPGSLQGFDAFTALTQAIYQPYIDDTYTKIVFQIVGSSKVGIYKDGMWYLDNDGSGTWNAGDRANMFGAPGWMPVLGDWNGDGSTKIGVYKDGMWYLDYNGNGVWDAGIDKVDMFGAVGWTPLVGDWNGTGTTKIGVYKDGMWYLDNDGSGTWNAGDRANMFGAVGWTPAFGKWT
jgi:hypothetical protein